MQLIPEQALLPKDRFLWLDVSKPGINQSHKTETDNLDVLAVANEFVPKFDDREKPFSFGLLILNDCDNCLSNFT